LSTRVAAEHDDVARRPDLPLPLLVTTPTAAAAAGLGRDDPSLPDTVTDVVVVVGGGVAEDVQAVTARRWTV